jgi:glycine/D-amino acid oxidase-like deaminating enzyme
MSLDLRTGRPVWLINRKQIAGHRKLAKNISCEVAIVGGGVSGALIAHNLISLGKRVVIVDGRDVGMGSTMASTAILSYEPDVHLIDLISKIGRRSAVRAYRAGLEALAWIIHEVSSQKEKDALKGMMNTGFRHPAFPFGASIT